MCKLVRQIIIFLILLAAQKISSQVFKRSPLEIGYVSFSDISDKNHIIHDKHSEQSPITKPPKEAIKTRAAHSYVWVPGHIYHHAFIPGHNHHIFAPRPILVAGRVVFTPDNRNIYGGYGVGSSYGGQGAGHGYQIIFNA